MSNDLQRAKGYESLGRSVKGALLRGQFVPFEIIPREYVGDFEKGLGSPRELRLARVIGFAEASAQETDWLKYCRERIPMEEYAFCIGGIVRRRLGEDLRQVDLDLTELREQDMPVA